MTPYRICIEINRADRAPGTGAWALIPAFGDELYEYSPEKVSEDGLTHTVIISGAPTQPRRFSLRGKVGK